MDSFNNLYEIYSKYDNFSIINNALLLLENKSKSDYKSLVNLVKYSRNTTHKKINKTEKMVNFNNYLKEFMNDKRNKKTDEFDTVIYNRISSQNQIDGHSLNIQESLIKNYIASKQTSCDYLVFNDIHTGYSKLSPVLKFILTYGSNYKLYVSRYDRLTRNTCYLETNILPAFINNNIELIVVNSNMHFTVFNSNDKKIIRNEIIVAQNESDMISDRLKKMHDYRKQQKKTVRSLKSLSKHDFMMLKLITLMKEGNVSLEYVNKHIKKISQIFYPNNDYEPLQISTGYDYITKDGLSRRNIAQILNEYSFKTRLHRPWTIVTVDSLLKYNTRSLNNIFDKFENLVVR